MNLTIDIGNTRSKFAVFINNDIIDNFIYKNISIDSVQSIINQYPEIKNTILSSVRVMDVNIINYLEKSFSYFIELDSNTSLPIENKYKTKNTLGKDRIATIVGANNIYPNTNVLVIDMGTAITYEFLNSQNQYLGGTISPGLEMRFKALNHYTDKLPLLNKSDDFKLIANSTKSAIISGVQNGIIHEINGYVESLKNHYDDLKIFLTGGDAIFFGKKLKNTIFVNLNLNHIGLNTILDYNKEK